MPKAGIGSTLRRPVPDARTANGGRMSAAVRTMRGRPTRSSAPQPATVPTPNPRKETITSFEEKLTWFRALAWVAVISLYVRATAAQIAAGSTTDMDFQGIVLLGVFGQVLLEAPHVWLAALLVASVAFSAFAEDVVKLVEYRRGPSGRRRRHDRA